MNKNLVILNKFIVLVIIFLFIFAGIPPVNANYFINDEQKDNTDDELSLIPINNRKILYVDDNNTEGPWDGTLEHPFQFIMDAIDIVNNGDTIFVFNGVYNEEIKIIKDFIVTFSLIGEDKEYTHINGKIYLYSNKGRITIEGFTFLHDIMIQASTIQSAILKNNIINENLRIIDTDNVKIENNNFKNGFLMLRRVEACIIVNNSFNRGGIFITQSSLPQYWVTNTIENNTINGKHIRHYTSTNNIVVPEDTGQLIIANCKYFTIKNLVIDNVEYGIQLAWSSFNKISNCIITNASSLEGDQYTPTGVLCYYSQNNEISNCEIKNFSYGIYFRGSNFNTISNNSIINGLTGILLLISCNNIFDRNFIKNHSVFGIGLSSSKNNLVLRNTVSNNAYGIGLCREENTIILKNHITLNSKYGIRIILCFNYEKRYSFKIMKNNFIENEENAYLEYSKGLWFRNYWDCQRLLPYKIKGTTEFFLVWYNYVIDFFGYFSDIFKPPSLKLKRLYDYDLFPVIVPYNI
jgi:parallel beta-helix repeat protein